MNIRIKILINMLVVCNIGYGQMAEYYFMQQGSTYSALSSETVLWSGTFDNAVSTITIPSFTVNGTAYTSMTVSTNGFVTFGGSVPSSSLYTPISGSTGYHVAISPFGVNLQNAASGSSKISYNTDVEGDIVVQWQDVKRNSATGDVASFQVRLDPSTGMITILYGSVTTTYSGISYPVQVGLRGNSNSDFNNRTTTADWSATTAGTSNADNCRFNNVVYPASGLAFTWKPLYNPVNFTAAVNGFDQIDLAWQKNSLNHNVMLAYSTTGTFGTPVSGTAYTAGSTIEGGGTVLLYGDAISYNHTGINPTTVYYYRIWSYDGVPDYSIGVGTNMFIAFPLPYYQDFPTTSTPERWSTNMTFTTSHGLAGSIGLNRSISSGTTTYYAITPLIGDVTVNSNLSFYYRIVNTTGYPYFGTNLGPDDKIDIQVTLDNGSTYTTVHTIDQDNHNATAEFSYKSISLSDYAGDLIKIRFICTWGSGSYYVDIDNVFLENGTNMSYSGSTTGQSNLTNAGIASTDNDILRIQVITQNSSNPLSVTSITCNTTGSTNASNDIEAARIFYTTTPEFSTGTQFGSAYSNPSGTFVISGSQVLTGGNNYFWVAYDIRPTATAGNVVDAQCISFLTSESGVVKEPTETNPAGNRKLGAVLSGTKYIPADYATIALAAAALNSAAIGTGGVTFNVDAGHTESSTVSIVLTVMGTAATPIKFQKSGAGANPVVTNSGTGSVNTTAIGNYGDGVIILDGADYVTFDGIDVAASESGIEYGYYLRKASVTNGCSNVTIKNSNITMTKGTSPSVAGFCAANNTASSSSVSVTMPEGAHQNITFTGNTISNVFAGIYLRGHATFFDQNIAIGAPGAGNTIQNFAGNTATIAYGIYIKDVNGANISYNNINNTSGGGTPFTAAGSGIYNDGTAGTSFSALNNNINVSTQASASSLYGIRSSVIGEVQIDYNTIALANTVSSGSAFYFISNVMSSASNKDYSISHNTFQGSDLNNSVSIYLISNANSAQSPSVGSITYNTTSGTINRTASSGSFYLYYNNGSTTGTEIIAGNSFSNITQSGTSDFKGIYSYTNAACTHQVYNNTISGISSGSGSFTAIDLGTSLTRQVYGNQVYNISTGGTVNIINIGSGNSTCHVYKNRITNISTSTTSSTIPNLAGITVPYGTNVYIYNNFISDLKTPAALISDAIRGISVTNVSSNSFIGLYFNSIYLDASSSGTTFGSSGIYHATSAVATTGQLDLRNNIIVNKSTPNGTGKTVALRRGNSTNLANFSTLSDHNLFYAGTPGASYLIYLEGSNAFQSMAAYQAYAAPRDANSHSEDPPFVNVATTPYDLHMQTAVPCLAESAGQVISSPLAISADYDGDTRQPAPDIGADEFDGISGFVANPGSFTAAPLSSQQNRLTFTLNGNNDDVVIVYSTVNAFIPPAGTPVIGEALAGGTVVYYGDTSPYDHGGLATGTTYYYKAFSYNGASYSLGITGSSAPVVNPVTAFAAIAFDQARIDLSWIKNGAGNDVIVASYSAYMSGNPVNGTNYNVGDAIPSGGTVIYKGPASAYSHTGLPTWTQYFYKCWSYDLYNYYSSGSTTSEVTYADAITSLPYMMNFSGAWGHDPAAPPAWKVVDVGGGGTLTWTRYTGTYVSSPASARGYEYDVADDYLISPPLALPSQDAQLSWYDKVSSASSNNSYKVLLSTTNNQGSSFTTILGDFNCTNTAWTKHSIDLSAYQGQTVFLAFYHYYSQSQYQYFTIDDILVETMTPGAASLAFPPEGLLTYANPLLEWTAPVASIPISGYKVYLDSGPSPSTLIYNGTETSFQPSGLLNNMTYYWKVVPYNINGDAVEVPVWSFLTVRQAQLIESFEADYFPPVSWTQDFGWLYSITSAFHGSRSALKGTTIAPNKLITPLLDIVTGDRLEFYSGTTSSPSLRIQLMYSPDKTTWTNFGDPVVVTAASWGFNSVDLSPLAGNEYYLAFGAYYVSGGTSGNLFLDHVTGPDVVPVLPNTATNPDPPDLDAYVPVAPLLSWDPVIWGGIPSGYKVYFGTSPDPAALVYNGPNEYYQPGNLAYNTTYYWKVIPYNAVGDAAGCPVWSFATVPEGGVQIGRDQVDYLDLPIYPDYSFSYTQTIYLQSEINIPDGRISKIYYQWNGGEEGVNYKDWVIYMGHTTKAAFTSNNDWVPVAQMTPVFEGEVSIPAAEGWVEIILEVPFNYNNTDNLVIAVDENTPGYCGQVIATFYGTYSDAARGIKFYDDVTNPDPSSPPTADYTVEGYANIRMQLEDIPTEPVLRVLPAARDFGQFPDGYVTEPQVFMIQNNGIGTLTVAGVAKAGTDAGQFVLTDNNSYPVNLAANQYFTVSVTFNPTSEGEKTASLSIAHDASGSPGIVPLTGTAVNPVVSSFPFTETFEATSVYRVAWSQVQESGTDGWTFATGAGEGSITSAHSGALNARFTSSGDDNIAKLVSPVFDLSNVTNPRVIFWYGQEFWNPDQNELKVYYRTANDQPWVQIFHDDINRITWITDTLSLPGPSEAYQLAFEGIDNYGYPNVLDDITVESGGGLTTTWLGTVSSDWANPANWSNGVPGSNYSVIISGGTYQPEISTSVTVVSVTVQAGRNIIISATGSLNLTGSD